MRGLRSLRDPGSGPRRPLPAQARGQGEDHCPESRDSGAVPAAGPWPGHRMRGEAARSGHPLSSLQTGGDNAWSSLTDVSWSRRQLQVALGHFPLSALRVSHTRLGPLPAHPPDPALRHAQWTVGESVCVHTAPTAARRHTGLWGVIYTVNAHAEQYRQEPPSTKASLHPKRGALCLAEFSQPACSVRIIGTPVSRRKCNSEGGTGSGPHS